ncbi:MAG: tRNA 2-thiocytidine biosynthesis TtcA family protein [Proteobacteria bacterium]|jgi:tRNA 2-thiocytidine biosynthesis protein TtcA|nr:tRNA 2-thiocytidine biosynthesis protein TtcA [Desulfocapsa sp.]MBU3945808.1 tRNA 2-thiocytidine biosynthesis TtcA family protein [Pseudomonadota bacterium]MCG2745454.1 tRNA 2-thiocytidine biosynthesis TtcA family protein [Desulfobacteraceae bacterium]MBU3984427.1 tRNA 2-thiocytidine biosynthesis TtcA family protein [Pseudomonadota bacterium]MBU4030100.1 tRNA 2-thiocytidine biosynthesis TtcA family protein [Pseudomonadota bacterium]
MRSETVLSRQVNRRIGQAMQTYSMLSHGDSVLVAVSGGVDSLVLAWLLQMWLQKAPISYTLRVVHIDMGFRGQGKSGANPVAEIREQLNRFGISLLVEQARVMDEAERNCFFCARQRRHQLFNLAREYGCNKIAFGHHKDDLIETLFLNMLYSGNLSTMVPKQDLFDGRLSLIRPLAYIEKHEVQKIAITLGLAPIDNLCPLAGNTRRDQVRKVLQALYDQDPDVKASIFASMANVREGYLL